MRVMKLLLRLEMVLFLNQLEKNINVDEVKELLRRHVETLMEIPNRREPKPGELEETFLEEEFED